MHNCKSPENIPENTNGPLTSGFQRDVMRKKKKSEGGHRCLWEDPWGWWWCYLHPAVPSLPFNHTPTKASCYCRNIPEQPRRSACCPSPGHCISKVSDVYQSYQVNEILLREYLIFSLPNREAQGGLWNEIRESSVSLPEKAEGSEIQPSLADSIKTLNDASFSLLIEKQKPKTLRAKTFTRKFLAFLLGTFHDHSGTWVFRKIQGGRVYYTGNVAMPHSFRTKIIYKI